MEVVRETVLKHERREFEVFIHSNNLAEAFRVVSEIKIMRTEILGESVDPRIIVRSAYGTLTVLQDEATTIHLGALKLKNFASRQWRVESVEQPEY